MLIKDWVEAITIQSSKDQHRHTAAFRLNSAFQAIARDHLWSWLTDQFYFTTVPTLPVVTTELYSGTAGSSLITTGAGTVPLSWTGAEILIEEQVAGNGPSIPIHMKITKIGYFAGGSYNKNAIYLDKALPESFGTAKITLFRREYLPLSSLPQEWTADRLIGRIRFRDMPNAYRSTTRPTLQYLTRNDYQVNYGSAVESGAQVPNYYQMMASRRVPSPKFAPDVTGTAVVGSKPGVIGTYHLAFANYDRASGIMSPLGPITTYENASAAAGRAINVEYGTTNGVPECSFELMLFISTANPVGLDGQEITKASRINERMIPFYHASSHPYNHTTHGAGTKGGGQFAAFPVNEDIPTQPRYYPQADSQMVFLRELPDSAVPFCVDGKIKLPWFCDLYDSPPVPDNFQEIVNVATMVSIADSSGAPNVQIKGQYEFNLRKLRGRDLKRSRTGEVDPRYRGDVVPRIDRYGLLD